MRSALVTAALIAGCGGGRDVYRDSATGFAVVHNQRLMRGVGVSVAGVMAIDGDRGERGGLHPAVIEFVLGAPEGSFARYYTLIINHAAPPELARRDIRALRDEAIRELPPGTRPSGVDYARALGRRLAAAINRALATDGRFTGSAGLYWGVAADLELGILLGPDQRENDRLATVIHRFEKTQMVVAHTSGSHRMLAWDLSAVPGAFDPNARLGYATVAARAIALHPEAPR